jgi:hypothetical protein
VAPQPLDDVLSLEATSLNLNNIHGLGFYH